MLFDKDNISLNFTELGNDAFSTPNADGDDAGLTLFEFPSSPLGVGTSNSRVGEMGGQDDGVGRAGLFRTVRVSGAGDIVADSRCVGGATMTLLWPENVIVVGDSRLVVGLLARHVPDLGGAS